MEENFQEAQTQNKNKKIMIGAGSVACIFILGVMWYFFYFIKTPEYSLGLIKEAVEKHDMVLFAKHVDVDSVCTKGYEDFMGVMLDSDTTLTAEGKAFIAGFVQMMKTPAVNAMKEGMRSYVEKGSLDGNGPKAGKDKNNVDPGKIVDAVGVKNSDFKGFAYTKKEGKKAIAGVKMYEKDIEKEMILELEMKELEDRTWQVSGISNMREYISAIEKEKNKLVVQYVDQIKKIGDKYDNLLNPIQGKLTQISQNSGLAANRETARTKVLEEELLPCLTKEMEELKGVNVAVPASELHNQRVRFCELNIAGVQKEVAFYKSKDFGERKRLEAEIRELRRQEEEAKQRCVDLAKKAKAAAS